MDDEEIEREIRETFSPFLKGPIEEETIQKIKDAGGLDSFIGEWSENYEYKERKEDIDKERPIKSWEEKVEDAGGSKEWVKQMREKFEPNQAIKPPTGPSGPSIDSSQPKLGDGEAIVQVDPLVDKLLRGEITKEECNKRVEETDESPELIQYLPEEDEN